MATIHERRGTHPRDHVVQFYAAESELAGGVVEFLRTPVSDGAGAVIVATPDHAAAIEAGLVAAGVDVEGAVGERRLLLLDAAQTLASFMVDGAPDRARFEASVGGVVAHLAERDRPVFAFGEMVALLWGAGDVMAALELEDCWNELRNRTDFTLYCAYPAATFVDASSLGVHDICLRHSEVVAAEPRSGPPLLTRHFRATVAAPRQAREFAVATLGTWGLDGLKDAAAVIVSELATNAVLHGRGSFRVAVSRLWGAVRLTVHDAHPAVPRRPAEDLERVGGRGLSIVSGLSARWGVERLPSGKAVWAELDAPVYP